MDDRGSRGCATVAPVSVVVPSIGGSPFLPELLRALAQQTRAPREVVVVHSGPIDAPPLPADLGLDVRFLRVAEPLFAGAARNRGLRATSCERVAFLDADVVPARDWLERLASAADARPDAVLVGSLGYARRGDYWGMVVWGLEFAALAPGLPSGPAVRRGCSANMLASQTLLAAVGGFREDMRTGQDTELFLRLRRGGCAIYFVADAIARHVNLPGWRRAMRHLFRQGVGSARARRHARYDGLAARLWPLAPLFGLYRLAVVGSRLVRLGVAAGGPQIALLPGVALGLFPWTVGFTVGALRRPQA
jgi:GT2 family glycosyltransferase